MVNTNISQVLLTLEDAQALTTLSGRQIQRLVKMGGFPAPVMLPPSSGGTRHRRVAWRSEDVHNWVASLQSVQTSKEVSHV